MVRKVAKLGQNSIHVQSNREELGLNSSSRSPVARAMEDSLQSTLEKGAALLIRTTASLATGQLTVRTTASDCTSVESAKVTYEADDIETLNKLNEVGSSVVHP